MKHECGNCAYYLDNNRDHPSGYGKCRRFPQYVETNDGKWCGEHKPDQPPSTKKPKLVGTGVMKGLSKLPPRKEPVAEAAKVLLDACLAVQGMATDDMTSMQESLDNLGRSGWSDLRALTKTDGGEG